MRTAVRVLSTTSFVLGMIYGGAHADAQIAMTAAAQIGDFRIAVSNHYRVPEREVIVIHDRKIRDEEIPVVLFIAQRARVQPAVIVDLRLRGMSWWSISTRYHLGPDVYYVPVAVAPGPPYGKAYGHYKKDRKHWNTIVLADDDVVNLVQLRFLSEYYHVSPEKVIEARRGGNFMTVQREMSSRGKSGKDDDKGKKADDKKGSNSQGSNSQGNGRGRGRGGL